MQSGKISRKLLSGVSAICLIAFGLGIAINIQRNSGLDKLKLNATVLTKPRAISPFKLTNDEGAPFTNKNLKQQWTLMFFGFTSCPHICPTTMTELDQMYKILGKQKLKQMPKVVLVSIDPERDSLQRLKAYVHGFNKAFIGTKADKSSIDKLSRELGIVYLKSTKQNDKKNYDIDHSGAVMLFNPQGKLIAFFTMPHVAKEMATDVATIMNS